MALSLDDSGFWPATHFPAGEGKAEELEFEAGLCFPVEFPYEVESPVRSNETDCIDDDDFLAGLTRRIAQRLSVPCFASENLEKQRVSAGSPQSTLSGIGGLSGNGSPTGSSQVSSPPATPFGVSNDTWELIYAAAGQVARLKMSGEAALYGGQAGGVLGPHRSNSNSVFYSNQPNQFHQFAKQEQAVKQQSNSVWSASSPPPPCHRHHQHHHQRQVQIQNRAPNMAHENRRCGRPHDLSHSAWPPLQRQHQNQPPRVEFLAGSAPKRACAGTGVFLPRGNINPPDYQKKTGCSPVLVPAKVVHALNLNFSTGHAHPRGTGAVAPDHAALIARRNALVREQGRSIRAAGAPAAAPEGHLSHEAVRLPQEWTY